MMLADLLSEQGISKYSLSKNSGVPYTTLSDICSGKTSLEKCSAETVDKTERMSSSHEDRMRQRDQEQ